MKRFIEKHQAKIQGVLSCFDRVLFRGYLPIFNGYDMVKFLRAHSVKRGHLKYFLLAQAKRLNQHAKSMADKAGRPCQYLAAPGRKEDLAREIAERDGIKEGLVCVFSVLEPCRTFSVVWKDRCPFIRPARRKCLHTYYYFMDQEFGLIHVKVQTWFPFPIQVYVNGHSWLEKKFARHGIGFLMHDNVFLRVSDLKRAQRISDRFCSVDFVSKFNLLARRVNPLLADLLKSMEYYWVTAQSEYATDILFKSRKDLDDLAPRLLEHAAFSFGARDVMTFLGRKLCGRFKGELVSDLFEHPLRGRIPGRRIKHRMKRNWIKMYDKAGCVLRVETVINDPTEFRVRKRVLRKGRHVMAWVPLRKSVAFLFRYRDVSLQSNSRYLNALALVDDPTPALQEIDALTTRKQTASGRSVKPFQPLSRLDRMLFQALLAGEHIIHGFTNKDLCARLIATSFPLPVKATSRSAHVSRLLGRLHAFQLIAKIPRSRRWKVSVSGFRLMSAVLRLRDIAFPSHHAAANASAA